VNPGDFFALSQNASPPIHALIELRHPDRIPWRFAGSARDIRWGGEIYRAAAMRWKFPESSGGVPQGGTLEIAVGEPAMSPNGCGAELLRWFDLADHRAEIAVKAIVGDRGEAYPLDGMIQRHGTAKWDGKKIAWNADPDDRFGMHLNPWALDSEALLA